MLPFQHPDKPTPEQMPPGTEFLTAFLDPIDSIVETLERLVLLPNIGPAALGFDDSNVVIESSRLLQDVAENVLAWFVVGSAATALLEQGTRLDADDVETMSERFKTSNGDLDYVFGYRLSGLNLTKAKQVASRVINQQHIGGIGIAACRPQLPEISEIEELDEALKRVLARHGQG